MASANPKSLNLPWVFTTIITVFLHFLIRWRNQFTFSIDTTMAERREGAFSVRDLGNGNYEIMQHTIFLKPYLDHSEDLKIAMKRYLPTNQIRFTGLYFGENRNQFHLLALKFQYNRTVTSAQECFFHSNLMKRSLCADCYSKIYPRGKTHWSCKNVLFRYLPWFGTNTTWNGIYFTEFGEILGFRSPNPNSKQINETTRTIDGLGQ